MMSREEQCRPGAEEGGREQPPPCLSGDAVETLIGYGEPIRAEWLLRRLVTIQRPDGAIKDSDDGWPLRYQTARALEGLLTGADRFPEALSAAARAFDRVAGSTDWAQLENAYGPQPIVSPLCLLPALMLAGKRFGEPRWQSVADRFADAGEKERVRLASSGLSRRLACELYGLVRLERIASAAPALDHLRALQREDGSIRGSRKRYVLAAAALAQVAICWYRNGDWEAADRAMGFLEAHQTETGGFLGSYGEGADYLPATEHPSAARFYLEANRLRVLAFMQRIAPEIRSEVEPADGRLQAILELIQPGDSVVEVGCGKGRYLRAIRDARPSARCSGVDISPTLLQEMPEGVARIEGALEAVPCATSSFDVVFSVEAIEHSANLDAAVKELIRIAKPGGRIAIIDKQQSQWGRLECPPWERWPEAERLKTLLAAGCEQVEMEAISYDANQADGLMVIWRGRKVPERRLRSPAAYRIADRRDERRRPEPRWSSGAFPKNPEERA